MHETRPLATLDDLLQPVGRDGFVTDYRERQPLLLHGHDADRYDGLLSLADVDHILANSSLSPAEVCVLREGKGLPLRSPDGDRRLSAAAALELIYTAYRLGGTIKVIRLHERWEPLGKLCRALAADLSAQVQANVYLTPAGARGLSEHYDTHDVFVAQIHGTKHWKLYGAPFALPLSGQEYRRPAGGPGQPVQEFDLAPGDLLYLPRGWVHAATSQSAASLHLTLGVSAPDWAGLLRATVAEITSSEEMFRASPPPGAAEADLIFIAKRLASELARRLGPERLAEAALAARRRACRPDLAGHLLDLEEMSTLRLRTPVRRRAHLQASVSEDETGVLLAFHGKTITFSAHLADDVRFAATAGRQFTARDLPGGQDDAARMTLLRTLVGEGFLTIVGARENPVPAGA